MLPAGCWNDASRASIQKDEGTEVTNSPSHWGRKTNRHLDVIQPFLFSLGKNGEVHPNRPMKNKRRAKRQWRAKRMRNGHGEKISLEEKQPSSFPSLPGPKAVQCFLAKSRIWGFLLRYIYRNHFFLVIYMNRKIDPSIYPIRFLLNI